MRQKLLVVDDCQENRYIVRQILDDFPIDIHEAEDGQVAIEQLSKNDYFVILMDIEMPKMNGFECVEHIRKQEKFSHVPILFITAVGFSETYMGTGYQLGAVDYLAKPVNEVMLRSKVKIFFELESRTFTAQQALTDLREQKRNQELMLNYIADGVIGVNDSNKITYANSAACTLLTTSSDSIIGTDIKDIVDPESDPNAWLQSDFIQTFREGQCNHCDDTFFWRQKKFQFPVQFTQSSIFSGGDVVGGMLVFQDITERKEMESRLLKIAKYDQLTGLANRSLYWEYLKRNIEVAKRKNENVYVLFIDLDRFKEVNDSMGHDAGDLLLIHTSERLRGVLRSADLVSRLGGDEFAVVIQHQDSDHFVAQICEKILSEFEQSFKIYGNDTYIGCSIGVARYPTDGEDAGTVTKSADTAMYSAKTSGRNNYKFFQTKMHERVQSQLRVANELRAALTKNEIIPYFQLKVDIRTGDYVGAEALARWKKNDDQLISPAVFIPVAEETGLISSLGQEVLVKAGEIAQQSFDTINNKDFRIAVNISAKQLAEPQFAVKILDLFKSKNIDPRKIELELTETSLMQNSNQVIHQLRDLRDAGIHISIDDFGTGYSSLSYIKNLPLDTLKIDQSFVRDIGHDANDEKIVKAIIQLAHSLDLNVIAEGVESKVQLEFLESLGCDQAQGFLFSHPQPSNEFLFRLSQARKP